MDRDLARRHRLRRHERARLRRAAAGDAPPCRRSPRPSGPRSRTRAGSSSSPTRSLVGPRLREAILRLAEPVTEDVLLICARALFSAGGRTCGRAAPGHAARSASRRRCTSSGPPGSTPAARWPPATHSRRSRMRSVASRPTRSCSRPIHGRSLHDGRRAARRSPGHRRGRPTRSSAAPVTAVVDDDRAEPGVATGPARPRRLLAGDARDVRRDVRDLRVAELALERRHRALPFVTRVLRRGRRRASRRRGSGRPSRSRRRRRACGSWRSRPTRTPPCRRPTSPGTAAATGGGGGVVVAGWRRSSRFGSPTPATLPT